MRSKERIPILLGLLEAYWHQVPDLRLCQLLVSLVGDDNFYVEDDVIEKKLKELLNIKEVAEETITLTLKEIIARFHECWQIGVNPHTVSEGADPNTLKTLTKSQALAFMHEHEFSVRKNK